MCCNWWFCLQLSESWKWTEKTAWNIYGILVRCMKQFNVVKREFQRFFASLWNVSVGFIQKWCHVDGKSLEIYEIYGLGFNSIHTWNKSWEYKKESIPNRKPWKTNWIFLQFNLKVPLAIFSMQFICNITLNAVLLFISLAHKNTHNRIPAGN